jgi:hypothetical protein
VPRIGKCLSPNRLRLSPNRLRLSPNRLRLSGSGSSLLVPRRPIRFLKPYRSGQWHTQILWNKQAAFAALHCHKGEKLYAEGKLTYREHTSPNQGKKRVSEIVIEKIFSLEKKTSTTPNMDPIEPDSNALPW